MQLLFSNVFSNLYISLQFNVLGGHNNGTDFDDILKWDPIEGTWEIMGSLKNERRAHGISVINWNDVNYVCT